MSELHNIGHRHHAGCCFIIPAVVLRDQSRDPALDQATRDKFARTYSETARLRLVREAHRIAEVTQNTDAFTIAPAVPPKDMIFDCQHRSSLPGQQVGDPIHSADAAASTVFTITGKVAEFYQTLFNRNSVDGNGLDLVSSLHYQNDFDNAYWNGQQMVYGDGDGKVFVEFYKSPDVIGHELTHGVTQNESGLRYEGESGALNESISDVFGAVFNQWLNKWPVSRPEGWLIGAGIMGPQSIAKGKTTLRDMVNPGDPHCLTPQPGSYANFDPTADVHDNSGIPNRAFAVFAQSLGGNAFDDAIKLWYKTCTDHRLSSSASLLDFAQLTRECASTTGSGQLVAPVREAWAAVKMTV